MVFVLCLQGTTLAGVTPLQGFLQMPPCPFAAFLNMSQAPRSRRGQAAGGREAKDLREKRRTYEGRIYGHLPQLGSSSPSLVRLTEFMFVGQTTKANAQTY
jgi:hypothetical protein